MPMLKDPSRKYPTFRGPDLPDRKWPTRRVTRAPRLASADLRDGNQALASPLNKEQKWRLFNLLVDMGFNEIETGLPSASDTDYEFTRECSLRAPDHVWLQALCACRRDAIRRTVDAFAGAKKVLISLYIATSDEFRETVFSISREELKQRAVDAAAYVREITKDDASQSSTEWNLMFSCEMVCDSDMDFVLEISRAVKEAWQPSDDRPIFFTLPATVERSSPNIFADQVEIFRRGFPDDPQVLVGVHTHNDRGTAVAAAELAQLAGADRVEGCLFGNGERNGNMDIVTFALNLYTQGIDPGLDLSQLPTIRKISEELTQIPVAYRAPYAGDASFLAYSGGHQDGIRKALEKRKQSPAKSEAWRVPYLPIDPDDIGRAYEPIICINSQSGKGGIAYVLEQSTGKKISKEDLQHFLWVVKSESEALKRTLREEEITRLYLQRTVSVAS